jgi:hypothetical protein
MMQNKRNKLNKVPFIEGAVYGRLTILEEYYKPPEGKSKTRRMWKALCSCGTTVNTRADIVIRGSSLSCGCIRMSDKTDKDIGVGALHTQYKNRAKSSKLEFDLTIEEFGVLLSGNCYYCNDKETSTYRFRRKVGTITEYKYNGIDRIDSSKGYTKDNCLTCCSVCNYMKLDSSIDSFMHKVKQIMEFRGNNYLWNDAK